MKKKLIILLSIVVLFAITIKLLSLYFLTESNINQYLIIPVKEKTGYDLKINSIELGLFNGFNLLIDDLYLIDKPNEHFNYLLHVESFEIDVSILPLIFADIEVNEITIENIKVNHFQANEADIIKPILYIQDKTLNSRLIPSLNLEIPIINLSNLDLNFIDESNNSKLSIDSLNLTSSLMIIADSLKLNGQISYNELNLNDRMIHSSNDKIDFNVSANTEENQFHIIETEFEILNITGIANIDIKKTEEILYSGSIYSKDLKLTKIIENLNLPQLSDFSNINGMLDYNIMFNNTNQTMNLDYSIQLKNGTMKHNSFNILLSKLNLDIKGDKDKLQLNDLFIEINEQLLKSQGEVYFSDILKYDLKNQIKLNISKLKDFNHFIHEFELLSGNINGEIHVKSSENSEIPNLLGQIAISDLNFIDKISKSGSNKINANINFSPSLINLSNSNISNLLTNTSLSLRLKNYKNLMNKTKNKSDLNIYLNSKFLDLSSFLEDSLKKEIIEDEEKKKMTLEDLAILTKLNISTDIKIDLIKANDYEIEKIQGRLINRNNEFVIDLSNAEFAKGLITANSKINYSALPIQFNSNYKINHIRFKPILNLFVDSKDEFDGEMILTGFVKAQLQSLDSIDTKSIISENDIAIKDVIIRNNKLINKLGKQLKIFKFDSLRADRWDSKLSVKDEKIMLSNLYLKADDYYIRSKQAEIAFTGKTKIPLNLSMNKSKSSEFINNYDGAKKSLLKLLTNKKGEISLDINVSGQLSDPNIKLDLSEAEKKAKKELEKKLKNKTKNLLKKIF